MHGCPMCDDEQGWCEFCPKDPWASVLKNVEPGFSDDARKAFLADGIREPDDGLALIRSEMKRIELWAREPERRVDAVVFDGRFIGLAFADGSTGIIGD